MGETMKAELAQMGLITGDNVSGVINPAQLDETSFTGYGFANWDTESYNRALDASDPSRVDAHIANGDVEAVSTKLSAAYVKSLSAQQAGALHYYTGNDFEWINRALFCDAHRNQLPDAMEKDSLDAVDEDLLFARQPNSLYVLPSIDQVSKELLELTTTHLDAAMLKAHGPQRIVYRGVGTHLSNAGTNVNHWLDTERALGTVVRFDGYSSCSYSLNVASVFAVGYGATDEADGVERSVVYEILTPEGAPVEAVSQTPFEDEVVLPRQSSYVVVGLHRDIVTASDDDGLPDATVSIVQMVAVDEALNILDEAHGWRLPERN